MILTRLSAAAILIEIAGLFTNSAGAQPATAQRAQVVATIDGELAAFNRRDAAKFAAGFTEDGDLINARSGRAHGRAAIAQSVARLAGQGAGHAVRLHTEVKLIKPDVALVLTLLGEQRSGAARPGGGVLGTFILVKTGGRWQISACEIAPAASPSGAANSAAPQSGPIRRP